MFCPFPAPVILQPNQSFPKIFLSEKSGLIIANHLENEATDGQQT